MLTAPIALFVYNRPAHTRRTVEALQKNTLARESELFIFSDDGGDVAEVRKYLRSIDGFAQIHIIERSENFGLAKSIISGVTEIVQKYDTVIALEDDLVTSPHFLRYMNDALTLYKDDRRVASVHGYLYPVTKSLPETFFLRGADCWGWATWKRAWDVFEPDGAKLLNELEQRGLIAAFDMNGSYAYSDMLKRQISGRNNSWAIRWHASAFLANMLTLYPGHSLVQNIGHDESGTHSKVSQKYDTSLSLAPINVERISLDENTEAKACIANYFRSLRPTFWERILRKL